MDGVTGEGTQTSAAKRARDKSYDGRDWLRERELWTFAGVSYEILFDATGRKLVPAATVRECLDAGIAAATCAHVICNVVVDSSLEGEEGIQIRWSWNRDGALVQTGKVRILLTAMGGDRYVASARIAPSSDALGPLLIALSTAIVSRQGGIVLHAAGSELDGRAVLFIGPSGAGKTTATQHMDDAPMFALDRAVVYPTASGWRASILPVGEAGMFADRRTPRRSLPLAAVLRVRQSREAIRIARFETDKGVTAIRESLRTGGDSIEDELLRLSAAERLVCEVPVGEIHTLLGASLTNAVRTWLHDTSEASPLEGGARRPHELESLR